MKKSGLLALVLILLTGCVEKNEYYNVYDFQKNYTVKANDWVEASDEDFGVYFYCQIKEPALTYDVFNYGIMTAYMYYVQPQSRVTELYLLPFDDYFVDSYGYRWSEQVSCSFSPGYITFILKYDEQTHFKPSLNYEFQVRFLW